MLYLVLEGRVYNFEMQENVMINDGYADYPVDLVTRDVQATLDNYSDWVIVDAPSALKAQNFACYLDKNYMKNLLLKRKHDALISYVSILLFEGVSYMPKYVKDLRSQDMETIHALDLIGLFSPWIYVWRKSWELTNA